jgi:hypothetical protein
VAARVLLLRLCALAQVTFLPGYLVLAAVGIRASSGLQAIVRAFAASLVANWVLVWVLTVAGIYGPAALYAVFAAECVWLVRLQWGKPVPADLLRRARASLLGAPLPFLLALALAIATAAAFTAYALQNHDAVFAEWDAVVSWNRWALDWAEGRLPGNALHYPQLLPASWSVLYVFSRDTVVQAPALILQALYPLGVVLVFLEAGLRRRSVPLLVAAPIWACLAHLMASTWGALPHVLSNGYADIPVAFFALLAVATALYADERADSSWLLALFFACGAALTKQAGLYVLAFVWGWGLLAVRRRDFALRSGLLVLALVGTWYGLKELQIRAGADGSEIAWITGGVHFGRGPIERVLHAAKLLRAIPLLGGLGWAGGATVVALVALSLRHPLQRVLVLGLVLPFLAIWLFLVSYDTRNASLALPVVALALAHAFARRTAGAAAPAAPSATLPPLAAHARWPRTRLQLAGAAVLAVALGGGVAYSDVEARSSQLAQQREIGDRGLDQDLYRFFEVEPVHGKVLTAYQVLGFLPGFRNHMVVNTALTLEDLLAAERNPEIVFVLHAWNMMEPAAWDHMERRLEERRYRWIFDRDAPPLGYFRMVQIRP